MKILIADDHALFLKGLELIINDLEENISVYSTGDYLGIFSAIEKEKNFDLILTDLAMPGANWLEAIKKIHILLPETPIIILSAVFDKEIVEKTIENGAAGYIPKTSSNAEIIHAIRIVLSGGAYIPSELLDDSLKNKFDILKQINHSTENINTDENAKILTPRQIDVIRLIANGYSNKQIAYELNLTEGTVKLHVTAILKMLKVYNRTGAVREANRLGLI